jgi:hypothetical protein
VTALCSVVFGVITACSLDPQSQDPLTHAGSSGSSAGSGETTGGKGGRGGDAGSSGAGGAAGFQSSGAGGEAGQSDGGKANTPGACDVENQISCAGDQSPERFRCEGGQLVAYTPCSAGNVCDGDSDPPGVCVSGRSGCEDRVPGEVFCEAGVRKVCRSDSSLPPLLGPPEWQDFDNDGSWRPELDDPRWSGATLGFLSYYPSTGVSSWKDDVAMRVLLVDEVAYVSYLINTDDNGPNGEDHVYLGISEGSGNGAYAMRIAADVSGAAITPPAVEPSAADEPLPTGLSPLALRWWHTRDATAASPAWGVESATPLPWLEAAVWNRPALGNPRWAVTVRIDLSSGSEGLGTSGNARVFFGAAVNGGAVILGNAPPSLVADEDSIGDTIIPRRSTQWVAYAEPDSTCAGRRLLDRTF